MTYGPLSRGCSQQDWSPHSFLGDSGHTSETMELDLSIRSGSIFIWIFLEKIRFLFVNLSDFCRWPRYHVKHFQNFFCLGIGYLQDINYSNKQNDSFIRWFGTHWVFCNYFCDPLSDQVCHCIGTMVITHKPLAVQAKQKHILKRIWTSPTSCQNEKYTFAIFDKNGLLFILCLFFLAHYLIFLKTTHYF